MNATLRQYRGEIGRTLEEFRGRPDPFGTEVGAWEFGGRVKKSSDYPPHSWQHAILSRDEGNPDAIRNYNSRFKS